MDSLPNKNELMAQIVISLNDLGKTATTAQIDEVVAKALGIPDELLLIEDANCTGTEDKYRMRWAHTALKKPRRYIEPTQGRMETIKIIGLSPILVGSGYPENHCKPTATLDRT